MLNRKYIRNEKEKDFLNLTIKRFNATIPQIIKK